MRPATIEQIREAVGGRIVGRDRAAAMISDVCHDSRQAVVPGCLFIALTGAAFDGHNFLANAALAAAALVHRVPESVPPGLPLIVVEDTRKAMGQLASWARDALRGSVIAVGGSNGKTGTKGLIHAALAGGGLRGTISPKSFNNDLGVPLAIFPANSNDDYLVLEMGTNHPGELRPLSEMAKPDIAVITNISAEHLEGFGDLDGVRREEATISAGLKRDGLLVVNGDDASLMSLLADQPFRTITFGSASTNDLQAVDLRCGESGVRFRCKAGREISREFFIPLLGAHTACNALAAIAVARRLGVGDGQIAEGLATAQGPTMRLQLRRAGGVRILNDAYNANPASMRAALETFAALACDGRRLAVLGEMRELGNAGDEAHRELGRFVATRQVDRLICVAGKARLIAHDAIAAGMPTDSVTFCDDSAAAAAVVRGMACDGDLILLKGSRGVRLELVESAIMSAAPGAAEEGRLETCPTVAASSVASHTILNPEPSTPNPEPQPRPHA